MKRLLFVTLTFLFPLFIIAGGEVTSPGSKEFDKGDKYYNGWGTKVNYAKALKWYLKAAEKGYARAQCQLGVMYENGQGVVKDLNEAEKWYKKALEVDLNDETARKYLANLQKKKAEIQRLTANNEVTGQKADSKSQPKSQELTVKSLTADSSDLSARLKDYERKDLNHNVCALLKIQMMDELERVEGNYIGDIVKRGVESWVYLTDGSKEVKLYPKAHFPLSIKFEDYGIRSLKGKSTYLLILTE